MTKEQSYTRFWEGSKRMWITFLFFSFIMIGFVQAANTAFAQTTVTVNVQDATLSDVLWEIQRQTDFTFIYSTNDVKNVKVRNLRVTNGKIAAVLDECLKNSGLAYVVKDGAIAIRPANEVLFPEQWWMRPVSPSLEPMFWSKVLQTVRLPI